MPAAESLPCVFGSLSSASVHVAFMDVSLDPNFHGDPAWGVRDTDYGKVRAMKLVAHYDWVRVNEPDLHDGYAFYKIYDESLLTVTQRNSMANDNEAYHHRHGATACTPCWFLPTRA